MQDMKREKTERKVAKDSPKISGRGDVPLFGDLVKGIVPESDHAMFMSFVAKRPRLLEIVSKPELSEDNKKELAAAYKASKEEQRETALVKQEAATLAPILGVSEKKTESYLEIYTPDMLRQLGRLAQREEVKAEDLIDVDLELLVDGSYGGREMETITVSSVHATLQKLVNDELGRAGARAAVEQEDVNLDNLWDVVLKECEGDEMKAAEIYAQRAEQVLINAKNRGKKARAYTLDTETVVDLFKLFNYYRDDIEKFLEYVQERFSLSPGEDGQAAERMIFSELLCDFVEENANGVVLNDRSTMYKKARMAQVEGMVESETIDPAALQEVGLPEEPVDVSEPQQDEPVDVSESQDED